MDEKVDLSMSLIKDAIKLLEEGKQQISEFAKMAHVEREELRISLQAVKKETLDLIELFDRIEERKKARRLKEINQEQKSYIEGDVKKDNKQARDVQNQFGLMRGQETQMRIRHQIELSLQRMNDYVEESESLVSTVGINLNQLVANLVGVGHKMEEMQQRQLLGLRIIRAQEEERKRVAREIHDGPAQSMANLVLRAEICEKLLDKQPENLRQELSSLKEMVRNSLQDVRKIIFELRPMVLDDLGIIPALKRYVAEFQQKNEIAVEFKATGNNQKRLSGTLEIAVFRIIQEALNNVSKHARAHSVIVNVEQNESRISLRVKDDGKGFDWEHAIDPGKNDSYGLLGMRERVELLQGKFKIITTPGQGTDILVKIPL